MKQVIFNFDDGTGVYFTSDTHFFHKNIINFCNRPFNSVEEMNETLITNWNKVVKENDYIFHLGDFCFGGSSSWDYCLDRLNGHKFLILGNHELKNLKDGTMLKFDWVGFQAYIQVEGKSIYLNHFPFLCYGGSYRGEQSVWQLFGHVHSGPNCTGKDADRLKYLFPTQYDVGVDNNNFTPVNFYEVKQKIEQQQYEQNQSKDLHSSE